MTTGLPAEFTVAWSKTIDDHRLTILDVAGSGWLVRAAEIYRELRTQTDEKIDESTFADIDIVDMGDVKDRYLRTQIPPRTGGNFDVVRSDLAEVLLAYIGEALHGYLYGYRAARDRELVRRTARGIDQIGVGTTQTDDGRTLVVLLIGEAKTSSDSATPPGVVDSSKDSLRVQHLDHMGDLDRLIEKVTTASKRARGDAFVLFQIALTLLEQRRLDELRVRLTSMLVRPQGLGLPTDFGSFHDSPDDYLPGTVDFVILRTDSADIDQTVNDFHSIASAVEDEEEAP